MATYESVLLVKNEVFVYRIPARSTNRGYRAAEWDLDKPDWVGRLRVVALNKDVTVKLEDKNSGELFAQCPVESYPGVAVEQVLDSSRYFVLRIKDPSGRSAFIGLGFADRGDSFDLLVSIQDHFKWVKREEKQDTASSSFDPGPKLDLGFKEGQTIKINIATKKDGEPISKSRPRAAAGGSGILPPPPGGVKLPGPPKVTNDDFLSQPDSNNATTTSSSSSSSSGAGSDLFFDMGAASQQTVPTQSSGSDAWGDFTGAQSGGASNAKAGDGWVQF